MKTVTAMRTAAERGLTVRSLAQKLRAVLGSSEFATEDQRKAVLRLAIHEHAAGLTRDEIHELVRKLRDRFPDRVFETDRSNQDMTERLAALEDQVAQLTAQRDRLQQRGALADDHMARLAGAAAGPLPSRDGAGAPRTRDLSPAAQGMLVDVAVLLFAFAFNQEVTARSVQDTVGKGSPSDAQRSLGTLLPRLAAGEALSRQEMDAVQRQLRLLQILPGALMAGAQQSWKGGTREVLEHLDPKSAKTSILKYPAMVKELERRFEEFWNQFDRNIDHYYRGRFERAYRDKMEEEP